MAPWYPNRGFFFENFWSSDPTSVVQLVEPNDVIEKMVYAYTNPTTADLVDTAEDWPGVSTFQAALTTGHMVATRPKFFFRPNGTLPDLVTVNIARPHAFAGQTQAE